VSGFVADMDNFKALQRSFKGEQAVPLGYGALHNFLDCCSAT
jgi:hypothetical protein